MGRAPCCDKANVKKGPWSPEEDSKLKEFIEKYGTGGNWIALPQKAGLKRCGKSCRLRWLNYLRPNIKHGDFSEEEDRIICSLFATIGSRWSIIAAQLPGRTDNDIKNYWNTKLKKKLMGMHSQNHLIITKPHSHPPFPSPLEPLHSQLLPPPPPLYNADKPLAGLEPSSVLPPNLMNSFSFSPSLAGNSSFLQSQESLVNSMQYYYPGVKDSFIMFGGDQTSCSSSDGSCSQISHGKEMKQEENVLQGLMSNGYERNQRFVIDYGNNGGGNLSTWVDQKGNGCFGNGTSHFEYEMEEIKQLISTDCNSFPLINDESKAQQERAMAMYYY